MRTILVLLTFLVATPILGVAVIVAGLFGVPDRPGSIYDQAPRIWCRLIVWAAGVRIHLHHAEGLPRTGSFVYAANHVSWFDIFSLAAVLRTYKFVAKAELAKIPLFGASARSAGVVFIDRNNRKSAFAGYEVAARRMQTGYSVVVCPEGTRGTSYRLRPFKKGPFVLAIAAQAPVIPTLVYGTMEVQRKGSMVVRSGDVHIHFLDPIPTAGLDYAAREGLARAAWRAIAAEMERCYGVVSDERAAASARDADGEPAPPAEVVS